MKLYSINFGKDSFRVALVNGKEEMKKGLSDSKPLKKGYGMLFDFKEEQEVTMNMGGMNYALDMIFMDDKKKIIKAVKMSKKADDIKVKGVRYVLEINKGEAKRVLGKDAEFCDGLKEATKHEEKHEEKHDKATRSGVNIIITIEGVPEEMKEKFKRGGSINIKERDVKAQSGRMQVLDDDGVVLMNITGQGERIFSIKHTEKLVDLAKKVRSGEANSKELGEAMKEIIHIQNTQEAQYV